MLPGRNSEVQMSVKLLDIELANLAELPDGRPFEWETIGEGEPMLWIEGGPGFPAHSVAQTPRSLPAISSATS